MVTYGSPEMVDLEVRCDVQTIKTERHPREVLMAVPLPEIGPSGGRVWEVTTGHLYSVLVGGELVHELEHSVRDSEPAITMTELPDGTRHMSTHDGRFAMTQGSAGTRVTLRDQAEWSRFGWHVEGDRIGWSIGSGVFDSRKVLQ